MTNSNSSLELFERIKDIIENFAPCMDDFLYVYDIINDVYYITEKALERFKLPANMFHDVVYTHSLFVYPDDINLITEDLNLLLSGVHDYHNLDYRWIGIDGSPVWINCQGRLIEDPEKNIKVMIGCINEIGVKQKADNTSGLLSEETFKELFDTFDGRIPKGYVLRIGLDDFKEVNEKFGMEYGDYVLRSVAECIEHSLDKGQRVFRIVGDEFIVLDITGGDRDDAKKLYQRIRTAVDNFIEENNYEAIFTISAGVVMNGQETTDSDYNEISKISQFSLAEAKRKGKNQVYFFDEMDYSRFLRKRRLLQAMRAAVGNGFEGFELYFQPIMNVREKKLYAAEALIRFWISDNEMISPVEFIPILEESGLIIPVGRWIIRNAMLMCQECQNVYPDFRVTINLSYIQMIKSPVFEVIADSIEDIKLKPSSVIVELTESGYMDNSMMARNVWNKFKNHGVLIAIDDFGTGYSNLTNIGSIMPNIIKIDRDFTLKALNNSYENQLLAYIVQMVHSLQIQIVIEGIETQEELERIEQIQPDYIQGYYYSKPCDRQSFIQKFITV